MTTEQTAGTPAPDDGDAAGTPTTGTPEADGRDADSGEPDYKAMYLEAKTKVESANRMQAELDELRARRAEPEPDDDEPADPTDGVDWAKVEDFARRGDEVAKAQLVNRRTQMELARDVRDSFHLRDIEDKSERQEVLNHYAKNRHRLADMKAAKAEVRERKLDSENAELRKQLEAARKQPPTDVVRTHSREISSTEAKARKMTGEEFDREQAQLKGAGRHDEAMQRQRELISGAIDIPG